MLWVQFYLHLRSLIGGVKSRNRIAFCYTNEKFQHVNLYRIPKKHLKRFLGNPDSVKQNCQSTPGIPKSIFFRIHRNKVSIQPLFGRLLAILFYI